MDEARFSLKDHLFNTETIGQLAREYAVLPGFQPARFQADVLAGLPERELLQRLDWIADCLTPWLPPAFPAMADALEAAMPPPLDPSLRDDDFGQFIHAVPGILAVRHGLHTHRDRALDLLHHATQRFSMEFYIRPFLQHWPAETLTRLHLWAEDENYHVRRLVSEGTRPRLPWAGALDIDPDLTLPLLDKLHADPARYVTRSVANHLNDLSKSVPERVIDRLRAWQAAGRQNRVELGWITRHALRTQIKAGAPAALHLLGYDPDAQVSADIRITSPRPGIGDVLTFSVTLSAPRKLPVLVDYQMHFATASGKPRSKTFKLKQAHVSPGTPLVLQKSHPLKANASTFSLYPGPHRIDVQVNGRVCASARFDLLP
jgi:3-methyladenine DNA glycosylase AlkC